MSKPQRFRKMPVEIEAVQWDGSEDQAVEIVVWMAANGMENAGYHEHLMDGNLIAHPDPYILISTLEGRMSASKGDWVIRGVKGEFYPCKPDIFAATYEPVQYGMEQGYPFGKLDPDDPLDQAFVKAWNKGADAAKIENAQPGATGEGS